VNVVRISPQSQHTEEVIKQFHAVLAQQASAADAMESMRAIMPDQPCNGYWYGKPGLEQLVA